MAMMAQHDQSLISTLTTSNGETVTSPSDILKAFKEFYEMLYTSALPSDLQPNALQDLLETLALGCLQDKEWEARVQLFTDLEVLNAIQSFPSVKAPGLDGLPIDFYKTHGDLLAPLLASLYTQCLSDGKLPDSMYHAYLTLIYKSPKNPTSCASYRPIALLNNDFKILTKLAI